MVSLSVVRRGSLVAVAVIALSIFTAPTSSAHARLVSTNPADGSVLSSSPSEVSFTFDESLIDGMSTVSINDESGELVVSAPVQPQGTLLSMPITTPLAAGTYQAAYRVVSADGHAVMGAITFTVASGGSSASTDKPAAVASSPAATSVPSAMPSAAPSAVPSPTPASSPANESSGLPWIAWLIGAAVVAVVGVLAVIALRRAPKDPV